MDRVVFGDNQFFAVNHASEEKARAQAIRFRDDSSIIHVLETCAGIGLNTFMCTTHERMKRISDHIRGHQEAFADFKIYPCMPYAHKYANAVTELGIAGTLKEYLSGNAIATVARGGIALAQKDFQKVMQLLIDFEMRMFEGIPTPVVFLQNVVTDLILGLGMHDFFPMFADYVRKFDAEAGFITMNLPHLLAVLKKKGVENPVVCASINKIGFRMPGGVEAYENVIGQNSCRLIAMQVLAAGALSPAQAFEYVSKLQGVHSILFGASTRAHIMESKRMIERYSKEALR